MNSEQLRTNNLNQETGASAWSTTEARRICSYQTIILGSYTYSIWMATFKNLQALSCKKGGFVTIRHNSIRDGTAKLLCEVCQDVGFEPPLQPLTGERIL